MTPDERIAEIQAELDTRLSPPDYPGTWTTRQRDAYTLRTRVLEARIPVIREAVATLGAIEFAHDEAWLAQLKTWRAQLCVELEAKTMWSKGKARWELSLHYVDYGPSKDTRLEALRLAELMREAGYVEIPPLDVGYQPYGTLPWHGGIKEVERRIQIAQKQRSAAETALAAAMLDDRELEQAAADKAARATAANAAPTRKVRGDGSVYLKYPDGRIEEVVEGEMSV